MRKDKVRLLTYDETIIRSFFKVDFSACLHQMKVARLLKYLQFRDYKSKLFRSLEDDDLLSDTGIYAASDTLLPFMIYQEGL